MNAGLKSKSMKPKINAKDLALRIANLAQEKVTSTNVVSIEQLRGLKRQRQFTPTLLVIEDDETVRKSLQRIFEGCGYRVLAASDGIELTDVLYDVVIDLVVLDVGLPWLNGFELALAMKEQPALKNVPLIFISGLDDIDSIKRGFKSGAHDFITKPFDIEKIKKTVSTLLKLGE